MKNVLFFSPTYYELPLNKNLKKKFEYLSEVGNIFVFAFASKTLHFTESNTEFYLFKKNRVRVINYLKIFFHSYFELSKIVALKEIEIVVFQDPVTSFIGTYMLKKKHSKVGIVVESHGDFINTLGLEKNLLLPKLYEYLFKKIAYFTIKNADIIRAVSSSTEKQSLLFDPTKKVVRFPAWVDFESFSQVEPKRDANGKFKILFIGSVTDRKKPHMIVKSLALIDDPNIELNIVGPTPNDKYLGELNSLIQINNLVDRVFLHGIKNQEEVMDYYATSNLMILPSVSEGLARVIFESQATACPVLVTDAPGMQDIVLDGQTGYVFLSNNLDSLVEKIKYIQANYDESTQVGINAKEFIISNFSAEKFKFSFKKVFDLV